MRGKFEKLPYILSAFMSLFAGAAEYIRNSDSSVIYKRMAIYLVIFYILGLILKSTFNSLKKEITLRDVNYCYKVKENIENNKASNNQKEKDDTAEEPAGKTSFQAGQKFDSVVKNDDEFIPLEELSRAVKSKLNDW